MSFRILVMIILSLVPCAVVYSFISLQGTRLRHDSKVESVSIFLSSQKTSYRVGEPLELSVKVKNTGTQPCLMIRAWATYDELSIDVYNTQGKRVDFPGSNIVADHAPPKNRTDFVLLEPGYFIGSDTLIGQYYPIRLAQPGTYDVEAILSIIDRSKELRFKHWHGMVRSQRLRITVAPAKKNTR